MKNDDEASTVTLYPANADSTGKIIYTTKESHKGIIIGKGGSLLKKISTYSRYDKEKMLGEKVNLKIEKIV